MKKKFSKSLVCFLLIICCFILPACSSKKNSAEDEEPELKTLAETVNPKTEAASSAMTENTKLIQEIALGPVSKFSGQPISSEDNQKRPLAVMIDNHPDARMQAGFRQADLVFEMIVEGTYTRYMMLFHSQEADRVGPIRSARKYFIDRMQEFDSLYTHFGASAEGDYILGARGIDDIDGMVVPSSVIYRDNDTGKFAPHNAYANTKTLREYAEGRGSIMTTEVPGFDFYPEQSSLNGQAAEQILITYFADNQSIFNYHADSHTYSYTKDQVEMLDENDQMPLEIKNIIVQITDYYPNPEYAGILSLDQIGQGEGYFFSNGEVLSLTWSKADENSRTEYLINGELLRLNPGQTWILLVSPNTDIEFTSP